MVVGAPRREATPSAPRDKDDFDDDSATDTTTPTRGKHVVVRGSTMLEVEETIRIDAPVADVFEYMDRPENQPEITPSLSHSETLEELPNGGKRVAYTYTMAGIDLDGEIRATEYDPEAHIVWEMTGDLTGEIEWRFEEDAGETVVTYIGRYEIPIPVLDAVVKPFVRRYNERELRTTLENLKTRVEAGAAASA